MTRPPLEVADIIRQDGAAYLARYGAVTSTAQRRVLQAVAPCRTAVLGGHKAPCDHGGHEELRYHSCRNRHRPKCQGSAQAAWLAARERELLEVPYCHVVFPLPDQVSPQKIKETDALFDHIKKARPGEDAAHGKRLSMDGKATVHSGACARGGQTRGDDTAGDHALGCKEPYIPCGIVDADTGPLSVTCGGSCKTSDCLVDTLTAWWRGLRAQEQAGIDRVQLTMDHGSESRGVRTLCLHRLVPFADRLGTPLQRLDDPPYPSQYHPIERGGGIMERHGNGAQLIEVETMLGWAKRRTGQGWYPVVELSRHVYQKGVSLDKAAMRAVEARLERHPLLPKWDILIRPAGAD